MDRGAFIPPHVGRESAKANVFTDLCPGTRGFMYKYTRHTATCTCTVHVYTCTSK